MRWLPKILVSVVGLMLAVATGGQAQQSETGGEASIFPNHGFLITGYGAASFRATFAEDNTPNNFKTLLAPIFLFQISDRFLFEAELEFELEEGVTVAELEYAQIDISLTNNLRLVLGKFLLPFNTFGERRHPTWVNPFVSPPAIYGHHGGAGPTDPLLPILTDVGAQLRGSLDLGDSGFLNGSFFITQGPRPELEEHEDEEAAGEEAHEEPAGEHEHEEPAAFVTPLGQPSLLSRLSSSGGEVAEVIFGENFEDNNENKMVGGRVGFGIAPFFEVNLSGMTGAYDDAGKLDFTSLGAHLEGRYRGFVFHGEWVRTEQELFDEEDPEKVVSLDRDGYYLMLSYQYEKWQPLVRWSQILDGELENETVIDSGEQIALGLTYWIRPSLAVKVEYLINYEGEIGLDNNRLAIQWAFGF